MFLAGKIKKATVKVDRVEKDRPETDQLQARDG